MFGNFVIGIFNKKKDNLNKKEAKQQKICVVSQLDGSKNDDVEIFTYEDINENIFIDEYMNTLSSRTTIASSRFSALDIIPQEKLKINIQPDDFEHLKVIGRGYFGKVTKVKYIKDGQIYALKSLKKSKLKETKHIEHTKTERKILEIANHPFIVSLKFAFQTEKKLYFVMDCYTGGELFFHLKSRGKFNESDVKFYLAQIVLAIEFLHTKKILYRDLKPENIVLDKNGYIKLTDFGLAKENIGEDSGCTKTFCGTPEYLAPEIIRGDKYGKAVDIWCIGILFYEMLFGFPPFYDKNKDKLYKKIIFNDVDFSKNKSVFLSLEAKVLIVKLLDKNPKNRIKINQIRSHEFFKEINFNALYRMTIPAPFIPELESEDDYRYIDPNCVKEKAGDSQVNQFSPLVMKEFQDFTYADNCILMDK